MTDWIILLIKVAVFCIFLLTCLLSRADILLGQAPESPPEDWGAVSIGLEDVPYPHEVEFLEMSIMGRDVRMAYMDVAAAGEPGGQIVVLLHGLNFFGEYWAETIDALTDAGFRVVVPDQVGFGRSSKPIIPYSFQKKAANTRALLDELGVEEAAIVGHSMGGMLATRFAFSYPEATTHLVLVNMIGKQDFRLQRPWQSTEELYEQTLNETYEQIRANQERYYVEWDQAYEKYIRIHYGWRLSGEWPRLAMVRALNRQMVYSQPVVYEFPHIAVPTLILSGSEDGPGFPEHARQSCDAIPACELILLEDVGHNPHFEAAEQFHDELVRYLNGKGGGS